MTYFTKGALLACSILVAPAAQAQDSELDTLRAEIAAMQARVAQMSARLEALEANTADSSATAAAPVLATPAPVPAAHAQQAEIAFAGAPEIEAAGGWSFKPFGRINADAGTVSSDTPGDGFGSELRRVRLGVAGDIPGGFGYKVEVDFAGNAAELTDAYLSYEAGDFEIIAGQHNNFQGLDELTSSRFSSFIERAAFTDAFGFERRLGLSAQYKAGDLLAQAGVFTDNVGSLPGQSWSADGRIVYAPRIGSTQLHFGGSLHHAELESGSSVRYRQRPLVHFTSERPINTGNIAAESEFGAGLETALIAGPLHVTGEAFWQHVDSPLLADKPTFFGGYAEVGYFLTSGDSRGYKGGKFDRTKPASPLDEGGMGALQVVLRYDRLDLNDAGIVGGQQDGYFASLVWVPTDYTRFMVNYGRLEYSDAAIALGNGSRDYGIDVAGVRAQIDF